MAARLVAVMSSTPDGTVARGAVAGTSGGGGRHPKTNMSTKQPRSAANASASTGAAQEQQKHGLYVAQL
jgi:hypothetical protein